MSTRQHWRLTGAETRLVRLDPGDRLRCLDGHAWLTIESTDRREAQCDIVLGPGECLWAVRTMTCIVSALCRQPASIAVCARAGSSETPRTTCHPIPEESHP